jgi:hypothetical protein
MCISVIINEYLLIMMKNISFDTNAFLIIL